MTLGELDTKDLVNRLLAEAKTAGESVARNVATNGSKDNYIADLVTSQVLLAFAAAIHKSAEWPNAASS